MKIKIIAIIFIVFFITFDCNGQSQYDTIVHGTSQYSELNFQLGNKEMSEYEVNENDISIRNGVIEKNKIFIDTIALRHFSIDKLNEGYEIILSDKTWNKTLFGRQCKHLEDQVENYPNLILQRNRLSKEISFLEPKIVGDFIKTNYLKRIECIDSSDDKYMKKHLVRWIEMIENDSIHEFSTALSSHFMHVYSLFDLITPINYRDTVVCEISSKSKENPTKFAYQTDKRLNPDSTITYNYTDNVDPENSFKSQFIENFNRPFEKYHSEDEKKTNEIRLKSLTSEDKSYIELTKTGEFKRYLRIMESFMLDSNLNPKQSIYNYEIKRVTTSNKR